MGARNSHLEARSPTPEHRGSFFEEGGHAFSRIVGGNDPGEGGFLDREPLIGSCPAAECIVLPRGFI
jgi:hypothetical protein